jgi:hypothetical protein
MCIQPTHADGAAVGQDAIPTAMRKMPASFGASYRLRTMTARRRLVS